MYDWLTVWHLLIVLALVMYWKLPKQRSNMTYGGLVALPVLLLIPLISSTYFSIFEPSRIWSFFISQSLIIFSFGAIVFGFYEIVLSPRLVKNKRKPRHHFLFFAFGLLLSFLIFDLFNQPLMPSLVYGLGFNLLISFQYYSDQIYDILFSLILMAVFYVFTYSTLLFDLPGQAGDFWFKELSGITVFGLAVEKVITTAVFGAFWGPIYVGLKDVFIKKT